MQFTQNQRKSHMRWHKTNSSPEGELFQLVKKASQSFAAAAAKDF